MQPQAKKACLSDPHSILMASAPSEMMEARRRAVQSTGPPPARWFQMTRKMLFQHHGPGNIPVPLLEDGTSPPLAGQRAIPPAEHCPHPITSVATGRNQYGEWKRCVKCCTKIRFPRYGTAGAPAAPSPGKKASRKGTTAIAYQTAPVPVPVPAMGPPAGASSSSEGISSMELRAAMEQQSQEVMASTTTTMNQLLGPVMDAVQQMSMAQQQMQAWMVQQQTIMNMQAQQQAIMSPAMDREMEEEWDDVLPEARSPDER